MWFGFRRASCCRVCRRCSASSSPASSANLLKRLPASSKTVHAASLGCIAVAVILLIAPAAYHRIFFSGQDTEEVHRFGSWLVTCATAPLALGLSGDIYVVLTEITASAMIGAFRIKSSDSMSS